MSEDLTALREQRVVGRIAKIAPWLGPDAVNVRCTAGQGALVPLLDARRQLHEIARVPPWDPHRLRAGISRRLLGDADQTSVNELVADLNHAGSLRPEAVIVIEAAEHADEQTIAVLRRAHQEPEWLKVPVMVLFEELPTSGPACALALQLGLTPVEPPVAPAPAPAEVQVVLRAAAHLGTTFAAKNVADLLGWELVQVLVALQEAADLGEPLTDNGDGVFGLPPARVAPLREGVLPTLRAFWSRRSAPPPDLPPAERPAEQRRTEPRQTEAPAPPKPATAPTPRPAAERAMTVAAAAGQALDRGDAERAEALASQALGLLGEPREEHRLLRVGILLELAQAHWRGSGETSTLHEALRIADQAQGLLQPADPADIVAGALAVGAGIRYDLGQPDHLSDALHKLVEASRRLQEAGNSLAAARLLNDQAAVWVRLGDPVRAAHLLQKSREAFTSAAAGDQDPRVVRIELAETEHLLARLPFHAPPRQGLEKEALEAALRSAHTAAGLYQEQPDPLSLGRVMETQGRLLARAGDLDGALERLRRAATLQEELRDALGLARTAAALAEVLAAKGEPAHAVRLMGDSVRLNLEVGTPLGLAYNRRSVEQLARRLADSPQVADSVGALLETLRRAEEIVGVTELPPNLPDALPPG